MAAPPAEREAEEQKAEHLKFFPLEGRPSLLLTELGLKYPSDLPPTGRLVVTSSTYGFTIVGHKEGMRSSVVHHYSSE